MKHYLHVLAICLSLLVTEVGAVPDIRYVYDELGRLIAVIDPSGDTAVYIYDPVGNLLSIARLTSGDVEILDFSPKSGPIGSTVTLSGIGFSATANQNTVTFDGVSATVSSATTTQLVVTVPALATTGPVAVTAPGGSDAGPDFTVTTSGEPTIASFTPTIGVIGASVTVSGTNFQTTLPNNRLVLNVTKAPLSSASATSLGMTVPHFVSSGRLSITTPFGTAVSADDFFVPPGAYAVSAVASTSRATVGSAQNVAVGTANKVGLTIFDGEVGHRASVKVAPGPLSLVTLHRPDGSVLGSVSVGVTTTLIEPKTLLADATYQVMVDPVGSATGTTAITVYDVPADPTGTITAGGSSVGVTTTTPGQNGSLTFSADEDDRISLKIAPGPSSTVSIFDAEDDLLASAPVGIATAFIEPQVFPATGTGRVAVDPTGVGTGTTTLTLYEVPADVSGTITPGGSAELVTMTTPGQNALLTFSGTASQRVSLKATTGPAGSFAILNPNGSTLASTTMGAIPAFIDATTLGSTGTYSLFANPQTFNTGAVTFTLYDVPANVSGSLTVGGSAVGVTITTPGQNGALTFSGTASQQVTVRITSNTVGTMTVKLLKPDGSTMTTSTSFAGSFNLAQQTLPTTGTYTVTIDPSTTNVGSLNVQVTNP